LAGISGIHGSARAESKIKTALQAIRHRGTDFEKVSQAGNACVGIVSNKISGERGTGFAEAGGIKVFIDGDIYNDRENGVSDAEVALGLYRKHGGLFPAYLKGVFACAVCDGDDLMLARDAVGVRPLYFGIKDGSVYFASEMKALKDELKEIQELLPATVFSAQRGVSGFLPAYPETTVPADFKSACKVLREKMLKAVELRMQDGAVGGCFLSGGLDSSVIAAIAHTLDKGLPAITVGVENAPDVANAKIMAKHLGMRHELYLYDHREIGQKVENAVYALESFDEDCVYGTIANMIASGFAAKFSRVLLSGEGGDELFGGYHLLKDLPTESAKLTMMNKLIAISYNTAVQRLDRAMMANSVHYRTPFIDTDLIAYALQLPVSWKIHPKGDRQIEKYILREAFKDMLPREIYERDKLRFSRGTGTEGHIDKAMAGLVGKVDFNPTTQKTPEGYTLNSPAELALYHIFKKQFPPAAYERLVGRWDPNK
jgi:asparagine synthase (glutamine-hydrolysing)